MIFSILKILPIEVILKILEYIEFEALSEISSCFELINLNRKSAQELKPTNSRLFSEKSFIPSTNNAIWFLCNATLFEYYLIKTRNHVLKTLNQKSLYFSRLLNNQVSLVCALGCCGRVDLLKVLFQYTNEFENDHCLITTAAINNQINVLEYLIPIIKTQSTESINKAAEYGKLEAVKLLTEFNFPATKTAMNKAAKGGHLKVVEYLYYNRRELCSANALNWACEGGYIGIAVFLVTKLKSKCNLERARKLADRMGHVNIVEYLTATLL